MSVAIVLLCASLLTAAAADPIAAADPRLVGVWELTGVGGHRNRVAPERMTMELTASGHFRMAEWQEAERWPFTVFGRYEVKNDVIVLTPLRSESPLEVFAISWEGADLVLEPDPAERPALRLRFERLREP